MEYLGFHPKKILTTTKKRQKICMLWLKKLIKKKAGNAEWNNTFSKWYVHTVSPKQAKRLGQQFVIFWPPPG